VAVVRRTAAAVVVDLPILMQELPTKSLRVAVAVAAVLWVVQEACQLGLRGG
jgi:hypothetical protein